MNRSIGVIRFIAYALPARVDIERLGPQRFGETKATFRSIPRFHSPMGRAKLFVRTNMPRKQAMAAPAARRAMRRAFPAGVSSRVDRSPPSLTSPVDRSL